MSESPIVEVINFGEELLVGLSANTHLQYLGGQLANYGVSICRARVIADEPSEIRQACVDAWARSDLVITTGGLGPTADDLTRENIAAALEVDLVFDGSIEAAIQAYFSTLGRPMSDAQRKQCYRFKAGHVLKNDRGTAPGLVYRAGGKWLVMLPGPPHELCPMFEEQVVPLLQSGNFLADKPAYFRIRTCGAGESIIEERMQPMLARHGNLQVAYCACDGMVDVRLSSREGALSSQALQKIVEEVRRIFGPDFVCFGDDSLEEIVCRELQTRDRTLAVAESCTGGRLGDALTNVPGASRAFNGGVVCYSNDAKATLLDVPGDLLAQYGAVSPECAAAMATSVAKRLSADYGLSVTGLAGPDGGSQKTPVGTLYFGCHSPQGMTCKTVRCVGSRLDVKAQAVHAALDFIRRQLQGNASGEFSGFIPGN